MNEQNNYNFISTSDLLNRIDKANNDFIDYEQKQSDLYNSNVINYNYCIDEY